jgi:hypothetical protein
MADLTIDSNLAGTVNSIVSGSMGAVGPVTLAGLPDHYTISINQLPKIEIGVDPLESKLTVAPLSLSIAPIETSISIKEIPSVRTHLPANYSLALSLFGIEVAAVHLCGEGQVITEPYRPNPCEICAPRAVAVGQAEELALRR